ncbi:MAG: hypothetical protein EU549_03500 [Promethearchaeota archaeon]|nr:MAG: hypothetical protein EU549_03500 [Candidatus Lokiarchaeota archaeon]
MKMDKSQPPFLDYREEFDDKKEITFEVNSKIVVNSKASIKIGFKSDKTYPRRTRFRFVIPYGWEPIELREGFCSMDSTVVGKIKRGDFQIMIAFVLAEPLDEEGDKYVP